MLTLFVPQICNVRKKMVYTLAVGFSVNNVTTRYGDTVSLACWSGDPTCSALGAKQLYNANYSQWIYYQLSNHSVILTSLQDASIAYGIYLLGLVVLCICAAAVVVAIVGFGVRHWCWQKGNDALSPSALDASAVNASALDANANSIAFANADDVKEMISLSAVSASLPLPPVLVTSAATHTYGLPSAADPISELSSCPAGVRWMISPDIPDPA
jgi:hypothetical protein